jgi:O-antigen/teichoic acid export membrane protein
MVAGILVARIVGKEGLGELTMVDSTLGMLGVLCGFGLGFTATKYVAQYRFSDPERAGRIIVLTTSATLVAGLLAGVSVLAASGWLADGVLGRPEIAPVLRIGSLLLFVNSLNSVETGCLAGFEAFRRIARINVVQGMLSAFLSVPLVFLFGVPGAVASLILSALAGLCLTRRAVEEECRAGNIPLPQIPNLSLLRELPVLWRFSVPALLSQILAAPVTWLTNTMLAAERNGYAQLGLFSVANAWRNQLLFVLAIVPSVLLPVLSSRADDRETFLDLSFRNLCLNWMVSLPLSVLTGLAAFLAISPLYGSTYGDARYGALVLTGLIFFVAVGGTAGTLAASDDRMWHGAVFNLFWAVLLVVFARLFIERLGFMGVALGLWLAYFFQTGVQVAYVAARTGRPLRRLFRLSLLTISCLVPLPIVALGAMSDMAVTLTLLLVAGLSVLPVMEAKNLMESEAR